MEQLGNYHGEENAAEEDPPSKPRLLHIDPTQGRRDRKRLAA
jgi:hypothetical protein